MGDSAQANPLKQVRGSLKGIAAYLRGYLSFCELTNAIPSPARGNRPTSDHSVQGAAASGNYIARLQKACLPTRQPTVWITPAARRAA